MKKILILLFLSFVIIISAYSKSAEVQVNTSIGESSVSYKLYYNNDEIEDNLDLYEISILQPLNYGGVTNPFRIEASSNMNSDLSIEVNISAESFVTTLYNGLESYDSKITPIARELYNISTIPAGLFETATVYAFVMSWDGDDSLPAGSYTSDVSIEYQIN